MHIESIIKKIKIRRMASLAEMTPAGPTYMSPRHLPLCSCSLSPTPGPQMQRVAKRTGTELKLGWHLMPSSPHSLIMTNGGPKALTG